MAYLFTIIAMFTLGTANASESYKVKVTDPRFEQLVGTYLQKANISYTMTKDQIIPFNEEGTAGFTTKIVDDKFPMGCVFGVTVNNGSTYNERFTWKDIWISSKKGLVKSCEKFFREKLEAGEWRQIF